MRLHHMLAALSISALATHFSTFMWTPVARADATSAAVHFEEGVHAFEERRFADAADAFERSYQLQAAYQVLYNLGNVYAALGRPVESVDAFERYVRQGGNDVPAERRTEVERELERQRSKLAHLELRVSELAAEVALDAKRLGAAPLYTTVAVAAGDHVLDITLAGYRPERRELHVAPGQTLRVSPTLVPIPIPESPPSTRDARSRVGLGQRIAGYVLGAGGLCTVGVGVAMIARGQAKHIDAVDTAKAGERAKAERIESSAEQKKIAGYTVTGIGGAVLITGLVLLLSAPDSAPPQVRASVFPWASESSAGLVLERIWP